MRVVASLQQRLAALGVRVGRIEEGVELTLG